MKKIILIAIVFTQLLIASIDKVTEIAEHDTLRVVVPLGGTRASTGTGFLINTEGYLITNNHVVEGSRGRFILKNNYDEYKDVTLVKTYPKHDIAILKINNYNKKTFLKLQKPSTIKKGLNVYPLGFPGGADMLEGLSFNATLSAGIISKIDIATEGKFPKNYKFIQIDAAINHGNSGGPLLSKTGTVLGINTLGRNNTQGIFWAIHVEELIKILDKNNIKYTIDDGNIGEVNRMKNIWIILAVFGALVIGILIYISKKKHTVTAEVDEREISRLVKEKILKHGGSSKSVQEPKGDKENRTSSMNISLIPRSKNLQEINNTSKKELIVGRSKNSDVSIDNAEVSKEHVRLLLKGDVVEVTDLGSTNGTYIDGKKLEANKKYILTKGQSLVIGSEEVVYKIQGNSHREKIDTDNILSSISGKYPEITKDGIVGRSQESDIVIDNKNISRKHLRVDFLNDCIYITDLESANGTYINGKKISPNQKMELQKGQNLVIGSEDVVYQLV